MDKEKHSCMITRPGPPAELWIGRHEDLVKKTILHLQTVFCEKKTTCHVCPSCRLIKNKTHYAIEWIEPEKMYTLEQVNVIRHRIAFELAENERQFFILQKADFLTPACANSLLKSLEEPPRGYHFILLAERKDAILPTIQSRCLISTIASNSNHSFDPPLFAFFSTHSWSSPEAFLKELDSVQLHERQSLELLDLLISHWKKKLKAAVRANQLTEIEQCMLCLNHLTHALKHPPMPGSSKIFWKNLFLKTNNQ